MKFLVLATCVCMAVAAPPRSAFQKAGQAVVAPFAKAAAVVASPFERAASVAAKTVARGASGSDVEAVALRSESDVRPDGFSYAVETNNGIKAEASGVLKQIGDQAAVVVQGSYGYIDADGAPVQFTYVADENGYQPQSDSLPTPPPVPEAIARSLAYIAAHPQPVEKY